MFNQKKKKNGEKNVFVTDKSYCFVDWVKKKVVIFSFLFMWANRIFLDEGCKEVIGLKACDQSFAFIVKLKLNLG